MKYTIAVAPAKDTNNERDELIRCSFDLCDCVTGPKSLGVWYPLLYVNSKFPDEYSSVTSAAKLKYFAPLEKGAF